MRVIAYNALGKGMNLSLLSQGMSELLGKLSSLASVWQPVWEKENSEFKLALLYLKSVFMSHSAQSTGAGLIHKRKIQPWNHCNHLWKSSGLENFLKASCCRNTINVLTLCYILIVAEGLGGYIHAFSKGISMKWNRTLFRMWIWVASSIFYNDSHYTKHVILYMYMISSISNRMCSIGWWEIAKSNSWKSTSEW